MTFAGHAIFGAGICAVPFIWCDSEAIKWSAAVFGLIGGAAPDAVDWVAAKLGLVPRWELYTRMHVGDLARIFRWHPAYFLHLAVDHTIHKWPGYDWWNQYWAGEILLWVIGGGLLYFTLR